MAVRLDNAAAIAAAEQELMAGRGELGVVERAACRLAAKLAVKIDNAGSGDDPLKLSEALARTVALLPGKVDASGEADLTRLDEVELGVLNVLLCKAKGIKADAPPELARMTAEQREVFSRGEAADRERRDREDRLREERDRLWAENHRLLIANDELTRRAPAVAADGDRTLASFLRT